MSRMNMREHDAVVHSEEDEDGLSEMDFLFYGITALLVAIVFLAIFALPYTYASSRVWYSRVDLVNSNMSMGMLAEYRQDTEQSLGADYSTLFRDPDREETVGMQRVGHRCLSGIEKRNMVMPHRLHRAHGDATEYLLCAMTSGLQRLCQSENRSRLAQQLVQFNDRRQNVYAVERMRDEAMQSQLARQMAKQMRNVAREIGGGAIVAPANPKIAPDPDERITDLVRSLSEQGYLSASDFGYYGLILPADYVEHLVHPTSAPPC